MTAGQVCPDTNTSDTAEIVGILQAMTSSDVINNRAVARATADTYYVEGCNQNHPMDVWSAARALARAYGSK